MKNRLVSIFGAVAIASAFATGGYAQKLTNRVDAKTDWSVFVEGNPTECWIVSAPKSVANTRDGKSVAVNRGDILLFVSFRPGSKVVGELSYTGGYPFNEGSTIKLKVGSASYDLFVDGQWGWPASADDDHKITASMKRGSTATLTAVSSRGTKTEDTFSLFGFTAALEEAQKRCSVK